MASRSRYTNPIENLRTYIMSRGGLMKNETLSDLEWVQDKIAAADKLARQIEDTPRAELVKLAKEYRKL